MSDADASPSAGTPAPIGRRILRHPAIGLALFTVFIWNMLHWPPLPSPPVPWPPGVTSPVGRSPAGKGPECRVLAWVFRDGSGWQLVTTPGPAEEDGSLCTVAVLFEHGSFGRPYPTSLGMRSSRAIMHRRGSVTAAEAASIYRAARAEFGASDDPVEPFLASYLAQEHVTETHEVPFGRAKNTGVLVLAGVGIAGGLWSLVALLGVLSRWRAALLRRRHQRELLKAACCPACGYDLRGLPEKRCPECGFGWPDRALAQP